MAQSLAPVLKFFKPQPSKHLPVGRDHNFGIQVPFAEGVDPVVQYVGIGRYMLNGITDAVSLALSPFMAWIDTR
jgi:hypothetical protein